jgi:hypothetical protein
MITLAATRQRSEWTKAVFLTAEDAEDTEETSGAHQDRTAIWALPAAGRWTEIGRGKGSWNEWHLNKA